MLRRRVAFGRGSLLFGGIVAALLLALTQGGIARPAIALEERSFVVVADTVLVNNMGGIWVGGSMDCTAAVVEAYPIEADRPDMVLVNPNWEAYQYVGRTKVIHASYGSGIASSCYINPELGQGSCPCRWGTNSPFPVGLPQWVYSLDGKFAPGRIHIEVTGYGGWAVGGSEDFPYSLWSFSQYDLKAVKAKSLP